MRCGRASTQLLHTVKGQQYLNHSSFLRVDWPQCRWWEAGGCRYTRAVTMSPAAAMSPAATTSPAAAQPKPGVTQRGWCCAEPKRNDTRERFQPCPRPGYIQKKNQEPLLLTQHFPFQRKVLTPSSAGDLFLMDNRPSVYLHGSSATLKLESTILIKFYSSCQKQYGVREKLLCCSNKKVGVWVTWRCQKVIQF